ncbi:CAP domain-containing protein [Tropicimonas sp. IMCC6043]|uniref:CAP domain-containing protein n=1 Tax=Tropicimonas sp. IMCC6043 TaxID=2510645 RepID=UPI00101CF2BF|nr:CAP domain-containing protein [Tropicimonas sp. IMCC6043]RYH11838.1 CAP domain-containing protein [Tropicimonas sp. IMCC6043]
MRPERGCGGAIRAALAMALLLGAPDASAQGPDATAGITARLNIERGREGRAALRRSPVLDRIAAAHAEDMARRGYFAHSAPEGTGPQDRALRAGYRACLVAETIARGVPSAPQALAGWMQSPEHRRSILLRRATEFGMGHASDDIWVLLLAWPGC